MGALLQAAPPRGIVGRGNGRSYGDAAQNSGGDVLDCRPLRGIHGIDEASGTVTVDGGVTFDQLLSFLLPRGWFVAVTPGTKAATVAGAFACNVHGKNHHQDGSFASNVTELSLVLPSGERRLIRPDRDGALFWATAGGMGLTGFIARVTVRIFPIETPMMSVDRIRLNTLDELLHAMTADDDRYHYSVAWLDLLSNGRRPGRSVLTRGGHALLSDVGHENAKLRYRTSASFEVPSWLSTNLVNRATVRAFNEFWFRTHASKAGAIASIDEFLFPLDRIRFWNRLYGQTGFMQYQCVLPTGREEALIEVVHRLATHVKPVALAMLKRLGEEDSGPLSFPMQGWTLAVDFPMSDSGLERFLSSIDEIVADSGGRIYLAKDSRLSPAMLPRMYPRLPEWRACRDRVDPGRTMQSDLARRLQL